MHDERGVRPRARHARRDPRGLRGHPGRGLRRRHTRWGRPCGRSPRRAPRRHASRHRPGRHGAHRCRVPSGCRRSWRARHPPARPLRNRGSSGGRRGHRRGGRCPLRPRRVLPPVRRRRAGFLVQARRTARHADGPFPHPHRRHRGQHLRRRLARADHRRELRRTFRRPDRPCHRGEQAGAGDRPPRRDRDGGDPRRDTAPRWAPRQAHVPGAAHRGEPGARDPPGRAPSGNRRARARRTSRCALVPLGRGPHREVSDA